ncbi:MAG: hypothetical protein WKF88_03110 [Ferruginibacter sp.]
MKEIYDKHAAMMYGSILRIVKEKKSAEAVLLSAFTEIKTALNSGTCFREPLWFLKCARRNAFTYLQDKGLNQSYRHAVSAGIDDLRRLG